MTVSADQLKYDDRGLITAIAQDRLSGEIRMVAWMNREAVLQTLETGKATFFSRSRGRLWVKGEESGNVLVVSAVLADCDADTLLVLVEPAGPSCHTGRQNCFFQKVEMQGSDTRGAETRSSEAEAISPLPEESYHLLVEELEHVLEQRKTSTADKSYTRSLFDGGPEKIGRKIREEASEVTDAIAGESDERVASEAADVLFHVLVGLRYRSIEFRRVLQVLAARFGVGGHVEKAARGQS